MTACSEREENRSFEKIEWELENCHPKQVKLTLFRTHRPAPYLCLQFSRSSVKLEQSAAGCGDQQLVRSGRRVVDAQRGVDDVRTGGGYIDPQHLK